MPDFQCRIKTKEGNELKQLRTGTTEEELKKILEAEGYQVIELKLSSENLAPEELVENLAKSEPLAEVIQAETRRKGSLSLEDLALFNRQLAQMLRHNIPLPAALKQLSQEGISRKLQKMLLEMQQLVADGANLREALEPQRQKLPQIYIAMLDAGMEAGNLADILDNFAQYSEESLHLRQKLKEAISYPLLTLVFMIPVFLLLVYVAGPAILELREQFDPKSEGALYTSGSSTMEKISGVLAVVSYSLLAVIVPNANGICLALFVFIIFLFICWRIFRSNEGFQKKVDSIKIRVPFYGQIYYFATLSFTLRSIGVLVKSGVSLPTTLRLTASSLSYFPARESLSMLAAKTEDGEKLSVAFQEESFFPPYVSWLLAKDEGNSDIATTLSYMAEHYSGRSQRRIELLNMLILPTSEVILGLFVLAICILFILPLNLLSLLSIV